jgi:hypothetical protein
MTSDDICHSMLPGELRRCIGWSSRFGSLIQCRLVKVHTMSSVKVVRGHPRIVLTIGCRSAGLPLAEVVRRVTAVLQVLSKDGEQGRFHPERVGDEEQRL